MARETSHPMGFIDIRNISGFVVPIDLRVTYTDGSSQLIHKTPAIWEINQKQATIAVSNARPISTVQIESGIFIDADESNNPPRK